MTNKIRRSSATLLFLVSLVTLTSAFDLPNRSTDSSSPLASVTTSAKPAQYRTTLSFADRVAYQRAIEEVYWRHRIWPNERADSKPSLDAVMSQAQLQKKVEDYLRKSQALEDYWQRPITAEQLQAEMDRMAQHTKQPEVLRELFQALGDDPHVIAECLAKPALTERLLTNSYAYDERIHRALRQRAEADLRTHHSVGQMKQTSGTYSEIEFVRNDGANQKASRGALRAVKLNKREWDEEVQKLAAIFSGATDGRTRPQLARRGGGAPRAQIKTGILSPLQQDETRYYATAIIERTESHLRIATVSWRKEPLECWLATAENQIRSALTAPTASYRLPMVSDGAAAPMILGQPPPRRRMREPGTRQYGLAAK